MILKLPFAIKDLPVYPKDRPYTELEALIDLLISGHKTTVNIDDLAQRWMWDSDKANLFVHDNRHWFKEDIYLKEDSAAQRKAMAQEVIDIFNQVFDRKIQLNDHRIKTIYGRIKEGRHLNPPTGNEQFKAVFEHKKSEWTGTEQEKYLQIETLCAATHFLKYLDAARLAYKKKLEKPPVTPTEGVVLTGTLFKVNG